MGALPALGRCTDNRRQGLTRRRKSLLGGASLQEDDLMAATSRIEALFGATAISECGRSQIADERAAALVRATVAGPVGGYWEGYARLVLRCYLLAAALSDADAAQVIAWARDHKDTGVAQVLKDHASDVPYGWIGMLEGGLPSAGGERSMIFSTVLHALDLDTQPQPAL
jgi:hypothetical protein